MRSGARRGPRDHGLGAREQGLTPRRGVVPVTVALAAATSLLACSSATRSIHADADADADVAAVVDARVDAHAPGGDASSDAAPRDLAQDPAPADAGTCMMPLADASSVCPASYDDIGKDGCGPCAQFGDCPAAVGACGGYLIFTLGGFFTSEVCFYDSTTRALVSLRNCTDYPAYCDQTARCYTAGASVGACADSATGWGLRSYGCGDAGAPR
jgi:hypothetical protein